MAITLTSGVGSRGAGEVVQRQTKTGATALRLGGTFATAGVSTVEARVVISGGSVEVTNWTPLHDLTLGQGTYAGRFVPSEETVYAITALSSTAQLRITLAGRHMIEERRRASIRIVGNGTPSLTLDGAYTATGIELDPAVPTFLDLFIPVDNTTAGYQVNGNVIVTRDAEVPINRWGEWYNWQIRTKNAAGVVLETLNSTVDWGVGIVLLVIGQSNAQDLFTTVDAPSRDAADTMISWHNGTTWAKLATTPAGNGVHRLLNVVQDACTEQAGIMSALLPSDFGNIAVGAIEAAADSSALVPQADWGNGGAWLNQTGPYTAARTQVVAATDAARVEAVCWLQGEAEAMASTFRGLIFPNVANTYEIQPGAYEAALMSLYDRLRSSGEGYESPLQDVLPFLVVPPPRFWAQWAQLGMSEEIGSSVFQSAWPVVVGDGLEFAHSGGERDSEYNIVGITVSTQPAGLPNLPSVGYTTLKLDAAHGIKHTAPIRIEGMPQLSAMTALGQWQTDPNGVWIAHRVSAMELAIPLSSVWGSFQVAEGRVIVERGPAYATTRDAATDGLHITGPGANTIASKMSRAIARRSGIEGNQKTMTITGITAGATPVITFSAPHGLSLGATLFVRFAGTTDIDGIRSVLVQGASTVQLNADTAAVPFNHVASAGGVAGTCKVPSKREVSYTMRGPRIVGAVMGDELTGTVAAAQSRAALTLYVKHERGTTLTHDATGVLQGFEVHDEMGPMAVTGYTLGPAAAVQGGLQRIVLTLARNTATTEAAALDPYFGPDRMQGSHVLVRYGQFSSLPWDPPTNDSMIFDNAAGLAMPLLPTFGYLTAAHPNGQVPLSPLTALPPRARSFIVTTIAATATAVTTTIAGQSHATEGWRYIGQGSRMIRPGDRWFQVTAAGVRVNEGTVNFVSTYVDATTNVVLTLDRSVTTTDGNYLLIGSQWDGACALLGVSREGMSQGG